MVSFSVGVFVSATAGVLCLLQFFQISPQNPHPDYFISEESVKIFK
jgi:hypothetical protein